MKKRLFALLLALLMVTLTLAPVYADGEKPYVYDEAGLLDAEDERTLEKKLQKLNERYDVDVAVLAMDSPDVSYVFELPDDYAKDKFFELDRGGKKGGMFLVICMETRDVMLYHHEILTDSITDGIIEDVSPYLTDEEYAEAFDVFVKRSEYYINGELNGYPFRFVRNMAISVAVGFVIALIITGVMAGKLKTVRSQRAASSYVVNGSMKVTESRDMYLYSTVNRRRKPQNSSSSRGGGGSSSGTSRGKF